MDLSTRYLGLSLAHPIVASASPLTGTIDGVRRIEDAGAAAVVMSSLYEEQIRAEDTAYAMYTDHGSNSNPEAGSYFPSLPEYDRGRSGRLETLRKTVEAVRIPVIASVSCVTLEGWVEYATLAEQAGASALELSVLMLADDVEESGAHIEQRYVDIVHAVKAAVTVPVAVKLSPFVSSLGHLAKQLVAAGADGLVLFNRFYEPDVDLNSLSLRSELTLGTRHEIRLPLLWISLLSGRLPVSFAASRGVETSTEVVKYLLVGADVVMTTSALLRYGPAHLGDLRQGLESWLDAHGHDSLEGLRGRLRAATPEHVDEVLRGHHTRLLRDYLPKHLRL